MSAVEWLAELAEPACFPHGPATVQILQTHLSVVCLADQFVYKLKKAVTLPFVDFAPLRARRKACRDEVRLNRRLCATTYLGAASLRRGADGQLRFAATGDDEDPSDLDVAVVMQRLPQERMLDELLRHGPVEATEIEALARLIAAFHARAERGPEITAIGAPHRLAEFAAANFRELQAVAEHGLPAALLTRLAAASAARFVQILPQLEQRAAQGCIVDGHGDLHARNICMTAPPTVYDCIEFEPAFRIGDVATENAFLVMDLRYRGAPELANLYVAAYTTERQDPEQAQVLPTLCSYRAMVRAKVAAMASIEPELTVEARAEARHSAWRHLLLAAAYVIEARGPRWLVVCGPPASGKSTLCERLGAAVQWPRVATDRVRKALAGLAPTATARAEHYTAEFSQRTYAEVHARAAALTRGGQAVVVLDGNFPSPRHRAEVLAAARAVGAELCVVHVDISAAIATARAAARQLEPGHVSDAGPDVAAVLHADFVAPSSSEGFPVQRLDGTRGTDELAADVVCELLPAGAVV